MLMSTDACQRSGDMFLSRCKRAVGGDGGLNKVSCRTLIEM